MPKPRKSKGEHRAVLELEFSGLCALVLNNKNPKKATEARILLLRAEKILGCKKVEQKTQGMRWSARLCLPRPNLSPSTAADETLEMYGGRQLGVWRLENHSELRIDNAVKEPLVVSSGKRRRRGNGWASEKPSRNEPPEDISWLPEMEKIVPGAGKLKRGLWNGWGDDNVLLGKVVLTSGRIEAIQPSERIYEFVNEVGKAKTEPIGYQQCFANGIRVRIRLEDPVAQLRLTDPERAIELREYPKGSGRPICASVTNHSGSSDEEHTGVSDKHFRAFYAISQKGATLNTEQQAFPKELRGGSIHSRVRPCMGVQLYLNE